MNTGGTLTDRTKKELAELARRSGVRGWETMSKEELLKALARPSVSKTKAVVKTTRVAVKTANKPVVSKTASKPLPKPIAKPVPRELAKPTGKSAAKITRPGKEETTEPAPPPPPRAVVPPPPRAVVPASPPTANGTHSGSPAANGSAKAAQNANSTKPAITAKNSPTTSTVSAKPDASKPVAVKSTTAAPVVHGKEPSKDHLTPKSVSGPSKDRIIMAVHDPYWLHVSWELSAQSVQRAEAALKQDWYGAKLIIRLYDVTSQDTTSTSETPIRDIPIESDGSNWYINVSQPPRQYRADLGYISRRGILFVLARSNVVTPPKAGSSEAIDAGWSMDTKKAERILAMSTGFESSGNPDLREVFEERLKRSLGAPKETGFGTGATPPGSLKKFFFDIDAKLIVFGRTDPTAHLTLGNDPIKLDANGTFMMSFSLPDSRQIIPAVATSADGVEERTIVLAVERNTKYLDPMIHDQMNEI